MPLLTLWGYTRHCSQWQGVGPVGVPATVYVHTGRRVYLHCRQPKNGRAAGPRLPAHQQRLQQPAVMGSCRALQRHLHMCKQPLCNRQTKLAGAASMCLLRLLATQKGRLCYGLHPRVRTELLAETVGSDWGMCRQQRLADGACVCVCVRCAPYSAVSRISCVLQQPRLLQCKADPQGPRFTTRK